jgi:multiple sugar transport system permease protein
MSLRTRLAFLTTLALLLMGAAFILLPVVWLLSTAFKTPSQAFAIPPDYIVRPTLANFTMLFDGGFAPFVVHSLIETTLTTAIALLLAVPAGYAFARRPIRGGRAINAWFILTYITPPMVFLLPLYIMYLHLHLLDTYPGLVLLYLTGLLPFSIWLMRIYFLDVPREIDEAAWIDGASRWRALWSVVVPGVWPGLTTVGLLVAMSAWGEYFGALIITGQRTETATVGIVTYVGVTASNWSVMAAAGVVLVVPALIATIFVQRGFARTATLGAVK